MLRVFLGLAGVALITFGVFGGQSLELVHARVTGGVTPLETDEQVVAVAVPEQPLGGVETIANAPLEQADLAEVDSATAETLVVAAAETDQAGTPSLIGSVSEVQASARNKEVAVARALLNAPEKQGVNPLKTVALRQTDTVSADSKEGAVATVMQATNGNPESKTLVVLKDSVNLREGPSTGHIVVLELDKGQELMEFKRDGKWVHVGAYGTSGKIGWVHGTLVGAN